MKSDIAVDEIVKLVAEHSPGMNYGGYLRKTLVRRGKGLSPKRLRNLLTEAIAAGYLTQSAFAHGGYGYRYTLTDAGKAVAGIANG